MVPYCKLWYFTQDYWTWFALKKYGTMEKKTMVLYQNYGTTYDCG